MMKKALRNTMIFSLIIANLIIWPMLFSDLGEDSRKEASIEKGDSSGKAEAETGTEATENSEKAANAEEQTEDSSEKDVSKDAPFKILKIE
ncbi:hypothetical protein ACFFHH_13680 [Cytobacillus solani]|uniref:Uncharacterized protein n=1 Tax=Cytobacillus solani TaxID=1637975 RepID=A0A0Q3VJ24_9BACI|nr:hypothetical protein [Cytobacillus solani]KQL21450.1 hypothetical protein AN957_24795 [Cytobacillus solani]USK54753.1 hypothetical protein LIS82_24970 [Cytobacillus solani]